MYITLPFWIFLVAVLIPYALVSQNKQNLILLAASYIAYTYLEPRFVLLLALATGVTYFIGLKLTGESRHSRRWLVIGVGFNISVLVLFKYSGFFVDTIGAALGRLGLTIAPPLLTFVLPLGISFTTFRLLSYLFDVNKKRIRADTGLLDMALYIAFFPQIIAGPIERAANFIPALQERRHVTTEHLLNGLAYLSLGVIYKFVLADPLVHLTDANFAAISSLTSLEAIKTLILYSIRLYGDFAGYSAMAIGVSIWFGLPAMENFRQPYFSRSIIEFWSRWHISLSSWFRDYFFYPLSRFLISRFGNRRAFWFQMVSMLLTMILTGLWHGANLTFLIWGFLHGCYMVAERLISRFFPVRGEPGAWASKLTLLSSILITQVLVMVAWIFFRAASLNDAVLFFQRLFVPGTQTSLTWWLELLVPLTLMLVFDLVQARLTKPSEYWTLKLTWQMALMCLITVILVTIMSFAIVTVLFYGGSSTSAFVYQAF